MLMTSSGQRTLDLEARLESSENGSGSNSINDAGFPSHIQQEIVNADEHIVVFINVLLDSDTFEETHTIIP